MQNPVMEPEIINATLTSADTEYSRQLPPGTKNFSLQCRTAFDVRFAFATGRVATPTAPYMTVKSGTWYNSPVIWSMVPWDDPYESWVAEVNTITVADTWAQNDTVALLLNGRVVTVTIGTLVTTAQVATTIKEAWNGEDFTDSSAAVSPTDGGPAFQEFAQNTATVSASVVTLTANSKGKRWLEGMTCTATTAGNGSATLAASVAAAGPSPTIYLASSEAGVVAELLCWRKPYIF